jgi:uncharacterized membrane protein
MILATAVGTFDNTVYDIVYYLHILAAIVGYGGVFLNGLYGQQATTRSAREGSAIAAANMSVTNVAEIFIYASFAFGIILAIMAEDGSGVGFDEPWLSLSMLLWIVAIALVHAVMKPAMRAYNMDLVQQAEGKEPGSTGVDLGALDKKMGATGAALNLILVVILYLMIFKPGAGLP